MPANPEWTIGTLLDWTRRFFRDHRIDSPRTTAEILLAEALGLRRIDLYTQFDKPLNAAERSRFKQLVQRRRQREPVAYITGRKGFWSLDLAVSQGVLIPRPDTECLVESAVNILSGKTAPVPAGRPLSVLDLGTGSGAVILALAAEMPQHRYLASDLSPLAVRIARENARLNDLGDVVAFFSGDWFAPLSQAGPKFDLILSNPPYIPTDEIGSLQPEIHRFEPRLALDGGPDGLACLKHIIVTAPAYLVPGGYLLLEAGSDQRSRLLSFIEACGMFGHIQFHKDYGGRDRVVQMRLEG